MHLVLSAVSECAPLLTPFVVASAPVPTTGEGTSVVLDIPLFVESTRQAAPNQTSKATSEGGISNPRPPADRSWSPYAILRESADGEIKPPTLRKQASTTAAPVGMASPSLRAQLLRAASSGATPPAGRAPRPPPPPFYAKQTAPPAGGGGLHVVLCLNSFALRTAVLRYLTGDGFDVTASADSPVSNSGHVWIDTTGSDTGGGGHADTLSGGTVRTDSSWETLESFEKYLEAAVCAHRRRRAGPLRRGPSGRVNSGSRRVCITVGGSSPTTAPAATADMGDLPEEEQRCVVVIRSSLLVSFIQQVRHEARPSAT